MNIMGATMGSQLLNADSNEKGYVLSAIAQVLHSIAGAHLVLRFLHDRHLYGLPRLLLSSYISSTQLVCLGIRAGGEGVVSLGRHGDG